MGYIVNYMKYIEHLENDESRILYCDKCGELFYSLDNKEYVIDKEVKYKWDMFGDLESSEEIEKYKVIYRCPYCKWKYKEDI